jgi:putative endonuclease
MAYLAYILQSQRSGRYYYGHCEDVQVRLQYHNTGRVTATRGRGPWAIVHPLEFATRTEAAQQERAWKRSKSHRWIEQVVRASRHGREGR